MSCSRHMYPYEGEQRDALPSHVNFCTINNRKCPFQTSLVPWFLHFLCFMQVIPLVKMTAKCTVKCCPHHQSHDVPSEKIHVR